MVSARCKVKIQYTSIIAHGKKKPHPVILSLFGVAQDHPAHHLSVMLNLDKMGLLVYNKEMDRGILQKQSVFFVLYKARFWLEKAGGMRIGDHVVWSFARIPTPPSCFFLR